MNIEEVGRVKRLYEDLCEILFAVRAIDVSMINVYYNLEIAGINKGAKEPTVFVLPTNSINLAAIRDLLKADAERLRSELRSAGVSGGYIDEHFDGGPSKSLKELMLGKSGADGKPTEPTPAVGVTTDAKIDTSDACKFPR